METDNMTSTAEKVSKVDRLKKALEVARAALAAKEPSLLAALAKADDELKKMRKVYDSTEKDARLAWDAYSAACKEETVKLGLSEPKTDRVSEKLLASLKAFAEASGCPAANLDFLAREVISRELKKVPRIAALFDASNVLTKKKDAAHRAWNVASAPDGAASRLNRDLRVLRDRVENLEEEIKKVPGRNQQARERREEARQEEIADKDTASLRALLPTFSFVNDSAEGTAKP